MRGLASKYGRKRTFSRSCKSQRIGGSESLWQNGGWGYGGGLTTGEIDPLPRGFWLEALACSKEQRNQARKARPRGIRVWYVLWYAETKKRPKGAWILAVWRRGRDSNPRRVLTLTRFPGVRLKPLIHLSGALNCSSGFQATCLRRAACGSASSASSRSTSAGLTMCTSKPASADLVRLSASP